MAKKKANAQSDSERRATREAELALPNPVGSIPGPGRWLVAEFIPTAMFSLKISMATSSVGKTLLVPTPYSIKMALVDAAFRAGVGDTDCDEFLKSLIPVEIRIGPPSKVVVTHTFVKVRQESRDRDPLRPFSSTIAYRETAHHQGLWRWAFDLSAGTMELADRLVRLCPYINYIGKRGSFVRFVQMRRCEVLDRSFTQPIYAGTSVALPIAGVQIVPLDDFGPEADLATLSSYSKASAKRERHRRFVQTLVPLSLTNTGPGFSQYSCEG